MNWLFRFLRKPSPAPVVAQPAPQLTPAFVEERIDAAGRADVFARAADLGWTPANPAPLWVWNQIAGEVMARKAPLPTVH